MERSMIRALVLAIAILCAFACGNSYAVGKKVNVDKAKAERLYLKAVNLYNEGQLDAAVTEYIDAIEFDPTVSVYFSDLAEAYRSMGKNEMAIVVLEKAVAIDPKKANALTTLGVIYEDKGQLEKSLEWHLKAVAADPGHAVARNNLGHAYQKTGKLKEAEQSYRKSIEIYPKFAPAYDNLGVLLMNQRRTDDGIEMIKKAIAVSGTKSPQLGAYYNDLGAAYVEKKDLKSACAAFINAHDLQPENTEIKANLKKYSKYCSREEAGVENGTIYDGLQGEF